MAPSQSPSSIPSALPTTQKPTGIPNTDTVVLTLTLEGDLGEITTANRGALIDQVKADIATGGIAKAEIFVTLSAGSTVATVKFGGSVSFEDVLKAKTRMISTKPVYTVGGVSFVTQAVTATLVKATYPTTKRPTQTPTKSPTVTLRVTLASTSQSRPNVDSRLVLRGEVFAAGGNRQVHNCDLD